MEAILYDMAKPVLLAFFAMATCSVPGAPTTKCAVLLRARVVDTRLRNPGGTSARLAAFVAVHEHGTVPRAKSVAICACGLLPCRPLGEHAILRHTATLASRNIACFMRYLAATASFPIYVQLADKLRGVRADRCLDHVPDLGSGAYATRLRARAGRPLVPSAVIQDFAIAVTLAHSHFLRAASVARNTVLGELDDLARPHPLSVALGARAPWAPLRINAILGTCVALHVNAAAAGLLQAVATRFATIHRKHSHSARPLALTTLASH